MRREGGERMGMGKEVAMGHLALEFEGSARLGAVGGILRIVES